MGLRARSAPIIFLNLARIRPACVTRSAWQPGDHWTNFTLQADVSIRVFFYIQPPLFSKEAANMRLKSGIWVSAYVRRCYVEGVFAVIRRRGADEAGAIFIKVNRLDDTADVYGPAPQSTFDAEFPVDRPFSPAMKAIPASDPAAEAYLARQIRFDPYLWIIETQALPGPHCLHRPVDLPQFPRCP